MKCVCGSEQVTHTTMPAYNVSAAGVTARDGDLIVGTCLSCGVMRQVNLPFKTDDEWLNFYSNLYAPILEAYSAKDYEHDLQLASIRCQEYSVKKDQRILDVGSGSGAFVMEARKAKGADAYGCEIAKYHCADPKEDDFVYRRRFEDIHFPVDHFDLVTCHDVLEHVLDPVEFIAELFRVTKQAGTCVIDFPNYFVTEGSHHWKRFEHIWFFNIQQLKKLLREAGFSVDRVKRPIPSKMVLYASKPEQKRPSILVPPGIGDSYWSVVKMESFLKREGLGIPEVAVVCPRSKEHDGHRRSFPFLEMFPFLHSSWVSIEGQSPDLRPIWKEAYMKEGRTIFKNVAGFDYFIAYNGHLRVGKSLDKIDPDLKCDWMPSMFISKEQERYYEHCRRTFGKYIVFYFVFQGTYAYWTNEFPAHEVIKSINGIVAKTGCTPVFVGASWDVKSKILNHIKFHTPDCVDLVGCTSVEQLFGLLRGAEAVVGYPSGLTIMSTVLQQKTMIIWNDFYNRLFVKHGCPPSTWNNTYFAENTKNLTSEYLIGWATEKITGEKNEVKRALLSHQSSSVDMAKGAAPEQLLVPKSQLVGNVWLKPTQRRKPPPPPPPPPPDPSVTIACVLKSGGDFDGKYVTNLHNMLARNLTKPFKFVCLTDMPFEVKGCDTIKLIGGLYGWWSKIELFRPGIFDTDRVIYFDLDTLILRNIDDILSLGGPFYGLRPWNFRNRARGNCASGVMAWKNGLVDFIFTTFESGFIDQFGGGDQAYLSAILRNNVMRWIPIQDAIPGIFSYKKECRSQGRAPAGARIICFHGKPRVHECDDKWVKEVWR